MNLAGLLVLAAAIPLTSALAFLNLLSPPDWADEFGDRKAWTKLSIIAAVLGVIASVIVAYGLRSDTFLLQLSGVITAGLATVCLIQSLRTDYKLRLVDRRLLNIASIVTGAVGILLLISLQDWITASVTVSLLLFSAFVYLFVFSVGASDARALTFVGVGIVPFIGYNGFIAASLFAGLYFIVIGLTVAFVKRSMRTSFPAVPMLIFPYWAVLMITPFITIGSVFSTLTPPV